MLHIVSLKCCPIAFREVDKVFFFFVQKTFLLPTEVSNFKFNTPSRNKMQFSSVSNVFFPFIKKKRKLNKFISEHKHINRNFYHVKSFELNEE